MEHHAAGQLLELFMVLGFRPVATICKLRTPFLMSRAGHSLEVTLDRADGLGDFVEIETLAESETDLPAAQSAVLALARRARPDRRRAQVVSPNGPRLAAIFGLARPAVLW